MRVALLSIAHGSDLAGAVMVRDRLVEAERVEQLPLIPVEPSRHRSPGASQSVSGNEWSGNRYFPRYSKVAYASIN
jgi:hypothetical protein